MRITNDTVGWLVADPGRIVLAALILIAVAVLSARRKEA